MNVDCEFAISRRYLLRKVPLESLPVSTFSATKKVLLPNLIVQASSAYHMESHSICKGAGQSNVVELLSLPVPVVSCESIRKGAVMERQETNRRRRENNQ